LFLAAHRQARRGPTWHRCKIRLELRGLFRRSQIANLVPTIHHDFYAGVYRYPRPDGNVPDQEGDGRSNHLISGQYLSDMLDKLISVTSLTYPEGAKVGGDTDT